MQLRKCECGNEPTLYGFSLQCNACGRQTEWYSEQNKAIRAWNTGKIIKKSRMPVEEKIIEFLKEFQKDKKYSAKNFYDWHNRLTGSCEFGRDEFMKNHGITMQMRFTVDEFIAKTKNSYGGAIIEQLEKEWNR